MIIEKYVMLIAQMKKTSFVNIVMHLALQHWFQIQK